MELLAKANHHNHSLNLSLHHHRALFTKPISSFSLRSSSSPTSKLTLRRASSSVPLPPISNQKNQSKKPQLETLKPLSSLLKSTCVVIFTTSLFLGRFSKPSIAAPIAEPIVESTEGDTNDETPNEEAKEKLVEVDLDSYGDDVEGLKTLLEAKVNEKKFDEAIPVMDRLMKLEPLETQWPLMKSHFLTYGGQAELAKLGFEDIILKDPFHVEAYHGLVMAASESQSEGELQTLVKRIEDALESCKKLKRKEDARDFKLLLAQVQVIEGEYNDALKIYQELVKEEPRDFRPYLCQGIIYTILRNKDEAEKQFEKYRRLVPKEHPYAQFFDENVLQTKVFRQVSENQASGWKS